MSSKPRFASAPHTSSPGWVAQEDGDWRTECVKQCARLGHWGIPVWAAPFGSVPNSSGEVGEPGYPSRHVYPTLTTEALSKTELPAGLRSCRSLCFEFQLESDNGKPYRSFSLNDDDDDDDDKYTE
jgi:hypothetical protein